MCDKIKIKKQGKEKLEVSFVFTCLIWIVFFLTCSYKKKERKFELIIFVL